MAQNIHIAAISKYCHFDEVVSESRAVERLKQIRDLFANLKERDYAAHEHDKKKQLLIWKSRLIVCTKIID